MLARFLRILAAVSASLTLVSGSAMADSRTVLAQLEQAPSAKLRLANLSDPATAPRGNPVLAKEQRIALVIGNSTYQSVTALLNPANDAKAISGLLNQANFEVISALDLTREDMRDVLDDFAKRVAAKGPNTVALVYYAGHGVQIEGENFLVPIDAQFNNNTDVGNVAIRLADVMKTLDSVPSQMRIVILDACRNNPFTALGDVAGRGLAIVDAPSGSIVAYSTAPGAEAGDGAGRHSPYAAALLKMIKQPNMPIEQFFKRVRVLVNDATAGKQIPWESSSLTSDFAFFPTVIDAPVVAEAKPAPQKLARLASVGSRPINEAYEVVIEEDAVEYYEEFIRLYPTDPRCDVIRLHLARRNQAVAWYKTVIDNTPTAYKSFLATYPVGDYARHALKLAERPRSIPLPFPKNGPIFGGNKTGPIVGLPTNNGNNGPIVNQPNNGNNGPIVNKPNGPIINQPNNGNNGPVVNKPNGPIVNQPNNGNNGPVVNKPNGPIVNQPNTGNNGPIVNKPNGPVVNPTNAPAAKVTTLPAPQAGQVAPRVQQNAPIVNRVSPNAPAVNRVQNPQPRIQNVAPQPRIQNVAPQPRIQNVAPRQQFAPQRQSFQQASNFGGGFRGRR